MDLDGANYGALNDTTAQPVNSADDSFFIDEALKAEGYRAPPVALRVHTCVGKETQARLLLRG